jgi:acetyl-CoA C-acetyltransferase
MDPGDPMPLGSRTPVLVGVGSVVQREADPMRAREPVALMIEALERAAEDAGSRALLARADSVRAPRGFWSYTDPCRMVAEHLGAGAARTELAEIGVLQTTLLGRAAEDVARGRADVVLVVGAEARDRARRARRAGLEAPLTAGPTTPPDSVLRPARPIVSDLELASGLGMPVAQYAMIENALRAAEGLSPADHRRRIAGLWAALSRVAADNPDAWSPAPVDPATIAETGPSNPMLAFPYGRLHCSQWNVDQAAGLVLCSLGTARTLGLPRARFVFPRAVADAEHMVPLTERRLLHRCPGFARTVEAALSRAGCTMREVVHRELYSCFPVAVRVQVRELGITDEGPLTVTGGMAFAGGPLNHFVLQALVRMARVLRRDPGSVGLVTAVSGILTKQGASLWSTEPGAPGFGHDDVTAAVARETPAVEVVEPTPGAARVATGTVLHEAGPLRTVLLCDLEDGRRTLVASPDPGLAARAEREELCDRTLRLQPGGGVILD